MNTLKDYVNFKLTHADKVAEAEGYPLVMENCKKYKKMKDLKVYGNSFQDGTPTPDAPVEVVSVGDKSVNLATAYDVCKDFDYYTEVIEDGKKCVRYLDAITVKANPFGFKENTQYTVSFDCKLEKGQWGNDTTTPASTLMVFHYADGTKGSVGGKDGIALDVRGVWTSKTMTSNPSKTVIGIGTCATQYQNYNYIDVDTFQIQEGDTAKPYEPYGKYKIPVVCRGKNIATAYDVCKNFADYTETTLDGRECVRYQSNYGYNNAYTDYPFKENTQYAVSFYVKSVRNYPLAGANCILTFVYTDNTYGKAAWGDAVYNTDTTEWRKVSITSQAGKTVKGICTDATHYALRHYIDVNTFLLEESADVTEYEPYIEPVTTNVFMSEPLGIGEYIDFKNKKVVRDMSSEIIECQLPTLNAKTSIIEVDTSLAPSNAYGKYIKR